MCLATCHAKLHKVAELWVISILFFTHSLVFKRFEPDAREQALAPSVGSGSMLAFYLHNSKSHNSWLEDTDTFLQCQHEAWAFYDSTRRSWIRNLELPCARSRPLDHRLAFSFHGKLQIKLVLLCEFWKEKHSSALTRMPWLTVRFNQEACLS